MKGRRVVLDHINGQEAAALLVDGQLDDFLIDDPDRPRPGTIYRAICDRPMKGQGGMTVRLPDGGSGFLRQVKGLSPGQPLLVQVTGYVEDGKAVPLTPKILFKSRYAIATPDAPGLNVSRRIREEEEQVRLKDIAHDLVPDGMGLILRSACEGASEEDIAEDITAMLSLADAVAADAEGREPLSLIDGDSPHTLAWREWEGVQDVVTEPGGFEREGVLDALETLTAGVVPLGAGDMAVQPTRALVAVDVDTGGDTSPAAGLKANIAAAKALPRTLRVLGLGGQITVDFAPMSKANRKQVETSLRAAFRSDPIETALVGWTPLGHYELQRKRERAPLARVWRP
ncbi:ribonuclease E/G [Pelagovum pacificum]|uniref:Ribonuclease G n=1 Tax=Pelagovum pacificum TaxID=2588711 RepID=A0A5C5GDW5_9RHOB|nr:ribonuclease E/G [Pelagovum pacificum]QQA43983.1 ribonuclease E/G [Pelagovum pacificum]TNY32888.1 ribonuclease G [Pelagovum pacificum]